MLLMFIVSDFEVTVGWTVSGLDDHNEDVCVHQPHSATRGPRALAMLPARQPPAQAPRDHLRDQLPLPQGIPLMHLLSCLLLLRQRYVSYMSH